MNIKKFFKWTHIFKKYTSLFVVFQSIVILLLVGLFLYQSKNRTPNENTKQSENSTTTQEKPILFKGDTFKAELPREWTITESYNGNGSGHLQKNTKYKGLTGLSIMHRDNEIFSMQAIDSNLATKCSPYAKFSDFSEEDLNNALKESASQKANMEISDYSDTEYSEIEFLGTTFRRIETHYYYDTEENNEYFEPPCLTEILVLDGLEFLKDGDKKISTYFYNIVGNPTEEDLKALDLILSNMELIQ